MDKKMIMRFHPPSDEELASSLYVSWAGRKKWNPNDYIGFKTINVHVLVYVVSGKGAVVQGGNETIFLEEGSSFIIFPETRFRFFADSTDPWEFCWAAFGGSSCDTILSTIGISVDHFAAQHLSDKSEQAINTLVESLDGEGANRMAALGSLLMLFSEIGRLQGKPRKKGEARADIVPMAVRFIESYYFMHLDVDMLCDYVKYSRSYLSRLFNNELGVTIPEYINQVRVGHAKELFEQTQLSVQEVSASVGMIDSFYFSKTFKKLVGVSPNQYKKQFGLHSKLAVKK